MPYDNRITERGHRQTTGDAGLFMFDVTILHENNRWGMWSEDGRGGVEDEGGVCYSWKLDTRMLGVELSELI